MGVKWHNNKTQLSPRVRNLLGNKKNKKEIERINRLLDNGGAIECPDHKGNDLRCPRCIAYREHKSGGLQ